jgi:hypothetical protein
MASPANLERDEATELPVQTVFDVPIVHVTCPLLFGILVLIQVLRFVWLRREMASPEEGPNSALIPEYEISLVSQRLARRLRPRPTHMSGTVPIQGAHEFLRKACRAKSRRTQISFRLAIQGEPLKA